MPLIGRCDSRASETLFTHHLRANSNESRIEGDGWRRCAGMSGMEEALLAGCDGTRVVVVDAVRSGITVLDGLVRAQRR